MHTVLELSASSPWHSQRPASLPVLQSEEDKVNQQSPSAQPGEVDLESIKAAVRTILKAVGEDPDRDGLKETPRRVAKMYAEIFEGLHLDPARHLQVSFAEEYDELVMVRDIPFTSMCEHHLLPFTGVAHVGYIPQGHVTGLSKLARVVEEIARRPQVQERMTHKIAELIETELQTTGVGVIIQAEHSCMSIRGIKKLGSSTITSAFRGTLKTSLSSRNEFLSMIDTRSRG
ncbi:GTP cyclohydrolase I FolE [Bythopirellula polymerisocia]|uniref:GTP cyclohydrolase 1 n=1 Tax=Bythopirellula polymerisocia TaxID=2528003 RepID=A0A5C6D0X6_9BACT|nr:GTP cyclohydrolase I FolE [Bythopirellula polymerisocia]TWU30530.1 GTP cyclohydrolase 1 [Bythopirellula polymerisocia]